MRGETKKQMGMFSYISLEERVPLAHPLRRVKELCDEVLSRMSNSFDAMYSETGRPSQPPETGFALIESAAAQEMYSLPLPSDDWTSEWDEGYGEGVPAYDAGQASGFGSGADYDSGGDAQGFADAGDNDVANLPSSFGADTAQDLGDNTDGGGVQMPTTAGVVRAPLPPGCSTMYGTSETLAELINGLFRHPKTRRLPIVLYERVLRVHLWQGLSEQGV